MMNQSMIRMYVCKACGQDFGKGCEVSLNVGESFCNLLVILMHSTKVQAGTKHHDAVTHQETTYC